MTTRPPVPPFTLESAAQKVRLYDGLMRMRFACINDLPIKEMDRKYHWPPLGRRPDDHLGLNDLRL